MVPANSNRSRDAWIGFLLGLGAPCGGFFLRALWTGERSLSWVKAELSGHLYYYLYMAILTPIFFALFGAYLGRANDQALSQKRKLEALKTLLENQSMTDDVTGLYNHRHLLEEIEKEVERSRRHHRMLCGLMMDIDDFKVVNDTFGHLAGDLALREIAYVLGQSVRKIDTVGRYGGDEFFVIMPDTNFEAAKNVAKRIHQNIRQYRFRAKQSYMNLTASIGLFCFDETSKLDVASFIDKADEALLNAKKTGKDRIVSYEFTSP